MTSLPTLRRNGKYWVAAWRDSANKRRFQNLGPIDQMGKTQAMKLLDELRRQHATEPATVDAGRAPALGDLLDKYLELRGAEVDEATIATHEATIRRLLAYFGRDVRADRITRAMIREWRVGLSTSTFKRGVGKDAKEFPLSRASVRRHVSTAKQIFEWARRGDYIRINPLDREVVGRPPAQKSWTQVTDDDLQKILEACPHESWRLCFAIARYAGLRANEIQRATWGWVDWSNRLLRVVPKAQADGSIEETTKQSARDVPICPELFTMLEEAFSHAPEGVTLICPDLPEKPSHGATKIIAKAGLGWSKPLHTLRKSLESDWLAKYPMPAVCHWLGHDPSVALRHYHKPVAATIEAVTGVRRNEMRNEVHLHP